MRPHLAVIAPGNVAQHHDWVEFAGLALEMGLSWADFEFVDRAVQNHRTEEMAAQDELQPQIHQVIVLAPSHQIQ
jgi:hypothetical protein